MWILSVIVVLFTFFLNYILATKFFSSSLFFSKPSYEDSDLRSFYERMAFSSPIGLLSEDVVVVPTDSLDRNGIAQLLLGLEQYDPAVIGLDIRFPYKTDSDSVLLSAINRLQDRLVLPLWGGYQDDNVQDGFTEVSGSYFDSFFPGLSHGLANLGQSQTNNRVIWYQHSFALNGEDVPSFGGAIADMYLALGKESCIEKGESFLLEYGKCEFRKFQACQIVKGEARSSIIKDKIVVLGDFHYPKDIHPTIVGDMPGPLIHAYAIQHLISGSEIRTPPRFLIFLIVFSILLLFVWVLNWGKYSLGDFGNLFVRIIQFALMVMIYAIGFVLYIKGNISFNWLLPLSMIATEAFVYDVVLGVIQLFRLFRKK